MLIKLERKKAIKKIMELFFKIKFIIMISIKPGADKILDWNIRPER